MATRMWTQRTAAIGISGLQETTPGPAVAVAGALAECVPESARRDRTYGIDPVSLRAAVVEAEAKCAPASAHPARTSEPNLVSQPTGTVKEEEAPEGYDLVSARLAQTSAAMDWPLPAKMLTRASTIRLRREQHLATAHSVSFTPELE